MPRCIVWDKVDNPCPQSTPRVLSSFEVYAPPVTYPEEVDKTIGILMKLEPLDHTKLDDLGLNTCNHDIPLSSREIPSVDEPEPQLLPKFSPLDVNLGGKRGTDPPINPYSQGSFRMKVMNSSQDIPVDSNKTFSGQILSNSWCASVLDVLESYHFVLDKLWGIQWKDA
ncbi:hypothetical protein Tco_0685904 [Tanacetum coccineum]